MKLKSMAVALICLLSVGCSQGPDFSGPVKVKSKSTAYGVTEYKLEADQGNRGKGWGSVLFNAPVGFAEVGDTIVFKDGALMVSKD